MGEGEAVAQASPPPTETLPDVHTMDADAVLREVLARLRKPRSSDANELKDALKEMGGGAAVAARAKAMEELGKVRHAEIVSGFQSVLSNQVHLKRDLDAIKAKLGIVPGGTGGPGKPT